MRSAPVGSSRKLDLQTPDLTEHALVAPADLVLEQLRAFGNEVERGTDHEPKLHPRDVGAGAVVVAVTEAHVLPGIAPQVEAIRIDEHARIAVRPHQTREHELPLPELLVDRKSVV